MRSEELVTESIAFSFKKFCSEGKMKKRMAVEKRFRVGRHIFPHLKKFAYGLSSKVEGEVLC